MPTCSHCGWEKAASASACKNPGCVKPTKPRKRKALTIAGSRRKKQPKGHTGQNSSIVVPTDSNASRTSNAHDQAPPSDDILLQRAKQKYHEYSMNDQDIHRAKDLISQNVSPGLLTDAQSALLNAYSLRFESVEEAFELEQQKFAYYIDGDHCWWCGDGGDLAQCEGDCAKWFHISCKGTKQDQLDLDENPSKSWLCSDCNKAQSYMLDHKQNHIIVPQCDLTAQPIVVYDNSDREPEPECCSGVLQSACSFGQTQKSFSEDLCDLYVEQEDYSLDEYTEALKKLENLMNGNQ